MEGGNRGSQSRCEYASVTGHWYGLAMDAAVQSLHAMNAGDLSGRPGFDEKSLGGRVGIPALNGVESVLLP